VQQFGKEQKVHPKQAVAVAEPLGLARQTCAKGHDFEKKIDRFEFCLCCWLCCYLPKYFPGEWRCKNCGRFWSFELEAAEQVQQQEQPQQQDMHQVPHWMPPGASPCADGHDFKKETPDLCCYCL